MDVPKQEIDWHCDIMSPECFLKLFLSVFPKKFQAKLEDDNHHNQWQYPFVQLITFNIIFFYKKKEYDNYKNVDQKSIWLFHRLFN